MKTRAAKIPALRSGELSPVAQEALADLDWRYGKKAERPGGGKYKAVQNADGTWNIIDVPFFASHTMRKEEGGHEIGAAWQRKSVEKALQRWEQDGYLAPLIVNHHSLFGDVFAGGHFLPTRVGAAKVNGDETECTYADLLYVREDVYAAYRRGELPYLSTEFIFAREEHLHLSALDTEAPFFKFPLITIGEETPYVEEIEEDGDELDDGWPVRREDYPEHAPLKSVKAAQRYALALRSARHKETTVKLKTAKRADGAETETETPNAPVEGDVNKDGQVTLKDVLDLLKKLQAMIGGMLGGEEAVQAQPAQAQPAPGQPAETMAPRVDDKGAAVDYDEPTKPGDDAGDTAAATRAANPEDAMKDKQGLPEEVTKRLAEQQAEITVLKANDSKRAAVERREECLRQAETALAGRQIPNLRSELEKVYDDKAMGGETGLKAYVEGVKRHFSPAPPTSWNGEQLAEHGQDPAEVVAYAEHGADVMATARAAARQYEYAKRQGWLGDRSLEQYLKAQPALQGFKPRAAADAKK